MKTTYSYDHYYLYDEIKEHLETLEKTYSIIMSVETIFTTPKGRNVYAVTLSNGNPSSKPAYYVDGNTHAGEVTGSMAAMHTIDVLVTNYGKDASITKLLDENTVYVIPRISPDGAEAYLTSYMTLRSVDRPYLSEVEEAGLNASDIDEDGVLRMMRVPSPFGAWKKHPTNPNLLLKRKPSDQTGEFFNVYAEGHINEYDGMHIKTAKPLWGLDFNRNYPFGWFSEVRQPGAGAYPLSNGETRAVVDFVLAHKNIGGVCTHHTHSGIILCPPGTRPEKTMSSLDKKIIREIANIGSEKCGYPVVQIFDAFMSDQDNYSSGAFDDWCYQQQGIPAYTIELWDMGKRAGCDTSFPQKAKSDKEFADEYQLMIDWCAKNAPEAFKPWTKVNHPQLGEVEIGGFNYKFTVQNPPCSFLEEEISKVTEMTLEMAKTLPHVYFDHIDTTKVGEDTYKIDAYVVNSGYLPTYLTTQAKSMQVDEGVVLSASTNASLVSASKVVLGDIEGFSSVMSTYGFYGIQTFNSNPCMKKGTFYVTGKSGDVVTLKVANSKMGIVEKDIIL